MKRPTPLLLVILDGWGYSKEIKHNAIAAANTPTWDKLWAQYPHSLLDASGSSVGLPDGQMGNSEVGHIHIGAGRHAPQDLMRINQAVVSEALGDITALKDAMAQAKKYNSKVHILGLLSPGGVHSHADHIIEMLRTLASNNLSQLYLHAILDGRDTPPQSAQSSLDAAQSLFVELGCGEIASITGRYYAMDRDSRWERTQAAYDLLTDGNTGYIAQDAKSALETAYARGETDEFVKPTSILNGKTTPITIDDNDVVIFMNFRADRARQLTQAFTDTMFDGFERQSKPSLASFVTLTRYAADITTDVLFDKEPLRNTFGQCVSDAGLKQLRIAETEKYAHVTYFFNGGIETVFPGERRKLIPSPDVATYDLQPEMSADELTDHLVVAINSGEYDCIVCNYANPDMVGHTGNKEATIKAIETIDTCLARITDACQASGGEFIVTADHGNAEQLHNEQTGQAHTAHTINLVPALYVGRQATIIAKEARLLDIAPTLLYLMGLNIPNEMTGKPFLRIDEL